MADTITNYVGNGTQTDYNIPFDYLKKSFVRVYVDNSLLTGGDYGDTSVDYYFLDNTTIRLKNAPAEGAEVTIRRYTSATEKIVSFEDASILKATDLDSSQLQAFHIAEEARDIINDALVKDSDGNWDAEGSRITNVGDPVDGKDAINLDWYNEDAGRVQANADLTEQWKNEAEAFRNQAEQFKEDTEVLKSDTETLRSNTEYWANQAQASAGIAVSVGDKSLTAYNKVVDIQGDITNKYEQIQSDHADVEKWTSENRDYNTNINEKHEEVVAAYNELKPEIDIVSDNINSVNTAANNIDDIKNVSNNINPVIVVSGDLEGSFSTPQFVDMGRVGTGSSTEVTVTGGNIKTVADNIEDVNTVAGLAEDGTIEVVVNSVATTTENVNKAKQSEDNAKVSETNAKTSETNAKTSETNAKASENLAKDWAVKMDGLVNNEDYSSKYYAQQAKDSADSASSTNESFNQQVEDTIAQVASTGSTAVSNITDAYNQAVGNLETTTQSHISEINTAGSTQVSSVNSAGTTQIGLVEDAGDAEVAKVNQQGTTEVTRVETAGESQIEAIDTAGTTHLNAVNKAGSDQTAAVTSEGTKQVNAVKAEGTTQVGLVSDEGDSQVQRVTDTGTAEVSKVTAEGTAQVQAVTTAGTTQVGLVTSEGTKQVGLVTDKGETQVEAIDTAGSTALNEINSAKTTAVSEVNTAGTAQVNAVNSAGTTQVATINSLVDKAQDWAEKTDGPVEDGAYSAKYWAQAASFGQVQVDWNVTDTEDVAYIKNKPALGALAYKDSLAYTEITGTPPQPDLTPYLTKTDASSTYATKAELSSDISELAAEVDTKLDSSTYNTDKATFETTSHASSTYATKAELTTGLEGKANTAHSHTVADISDFTSQVNTLINNSKVTDYGRVGT